MTKNKIVRIQDFETALGIEYLESVVVKTDKLKGWDIFQDKEYTNNKSLNDKLCEQYKLPIQKKYQAPMEIRWINKMVEYGVFAKADIAKGDMVCEYTGYLEVDQGNDPDNLYLWEYPTVLYEVVPGKKNRKKVMFCVNAQKSGNYARFINHTIKKHQNVDVVMVPYNNRWHVIYRAKKDIKAGQQILTHYGKSYWQDRQIVPLVLMP